MIVVVNLLLAAAMLTWAARISANMLMAAALGGFLLRMMLVITGVVWAVQDEPWIDLKTLAVTILVDAARAAGLGVPLRRELAHPSDPAARRRSPRDPRRR